MSAGVPLPDKLTGAMPVRAGSQVQQTNRMPRNRKKHRYSRRDVGVAFETAVGSALGIALNGLARGIGAGMR